MPQPDELYLLYVIAAAAVATYLTRIGGYVLIMRMKQIPPRMEAALNAVPAAVLATLVAPTFVNGGLDVTAAMAIALFAGFRVSPMLMLLIGWMAVMIIRYLPV